MSNSVLEELGFEVAVERVLDGNRGLGRILATLVYAAPAIVSYERLAQLRVNATRPVTVGATNRERSKSIKTRVSLLRSALSDLGFPRGIITNVPGVGYWIAKTDAKWIKTFILAELQGHPST